MNLIVWIVLSLQVYKSLEHNKKKEVLCNHSKQQLCIERQHKVLHGENCNENFQLNITSKLLKFSNISAQFDITLFLKLETF